MDSAGDFFLVLAVAYAFYGWRLVNKLDEPTPEPKPFVVDLRNESDPATLDLTSRWEAVVRVETADGVETRLIDPRDGHLYGTFIEKRSMTDQAQ